MNISRVLYHYPYLQYDTGSPKSLVSMIDGLNRNMFEPLFLASENGPLIEVLKEHGVKILHGNSNSISWKHPFRSVVSIRRQARLLKENNINIVHLNQFGWNNDLVFAARIAGAFTILHLHNPQDIQWRNLNRFAANTVLSCSETLYNSIGNISYINKKCQVLHNQVDIEWIESGKPIREELGLSQNDIVVGVVAQIRHGKGIDIFVETARLCLRDRPELVFLIIGPDGADEQDYAQDIRNIAAESEFSGRIRFLGSRSDIPDILASLDIFMLPTRAEAFGIVVIEAMAAGLPVIASRIGGIPEIITNEEIGYLVSPIEPRMFALALDQVLARKDSGRKMGALGKISVGGRFDKATIGGRLNSIYQNLLG